VPDTTKSVVVHTASLDTVLVMTPHRLLPTGWILSTVSLGCRSPTGAYVNCPGHTHAHGVGGGSQRFLCAHISSLEFQTNPTSLVICLWRSVLGSVLRSPSCLSFQGLALTV
jgi:hypothetical protein